VRTPKLSPSLLFLISILAVAATTSGFLLLSAPEQEARAAIANYNFYAVGDWGSNTHTRDTVDTINDRSSPELVLGLGDYSYSSDSTYTKNTWWNDIVGQLHDNHMSGAEGNHDTSLNSLYNSFFDHPVSGGHWYYSFNYQNSHFVAINPNESYGVGSAQYNFVKADLASAAANSAIKWIFVYFHQPIYNSGGGHAPLAALRDAYHPLFDQYRVDLVFQGHNHNYERSYPIKFNPSNHAAPTVTTSEKTNYSDPSGEIYVVAGTGGATPYTLTNKLPYIVTSFSGKYGASEVAITNDGTKLTYRWWPNGGGAPLDTLTMVKP
jgi:hypothetical protein